MKQISCVNDIEIISNTYSLGIGPIENSRIHLITTYIQYLPKIFKPPDIDPSTGYIWNENLYLDYIGHTDDYGHFSLDISELMNINTSKKKILLFSNSFKTSFEHIFF